MVRAFIAPCHSYQLVLPLQNFFLCSFVQFGTHPSFSHMNFFCFFPSKASARILFRFQLQFMSSLLHIAQVALSTVHCCNNLNRHADMVGSPTNSISLYFLQSLTFSTNLGSSLFVTADRSTDPSAVVKSSICCQQNFVQTVSREKQSISKEYYDCT